MRRTAAPAFGVLLGGLGVFGWGGVSLAQEGPFPTASESSRVRATIAVVQPVQGKPSANASGAQKAPFADLQAAQEKEEARKNPTAECVEPPPMVRWQDYDGPLKRTVGTFAGRLERKSAHPPHYKPGAVLCSFAPKDKFILFLQDMIDPVTFLGTGFDAGIDQAQNNDPTFGQGAAGYGKRFGADFAGEASSTFFKDFAFPSLFAEDPRYYRLVHASGGRRLFHAVRHAFVAHRDNGRRMFNFSEWMGTTSAVALSNTFHPGNRRGFAPAAERVGWSVLTDVGFDVLREFWPEISRKFKLPFRGAQEPDAQVKPDTN
jgi:hypothetical protein